MFYIHTLMYHKNSISNTHIKIINRQDWDDIIGMMNDGRSRLEKAVNQWELHDDSIRALTKWLLDTETSLKGEGEMQATLPEKRSQLERIKVSVWF